MVNRKEARCIIVPMIVTTRSLSKLDLDCLQDMHAQVYCSRYTVDDTRDESLHAIE